MAAPQPLYRLLKFNWPKKIPVGEVRLLEAKITALLVSELKERFRKRYKDWLLMIKSQREGERTVLDSQFFKQMIQEIILTGDYTVEGIARYTGYHEDQQFPVFEPPSKLGAKLIYFDPCLTSFLMDDLSKVTAKHDDFF